MFRVLKVVVVSLGCAMFAFILRSAYGDRKSNQVDDLIDRLRRMGF